MVAAAVGLPAADARADALDDAKARGLVGERPDGYLGVVGGGGAVRALVERVNGERRTRYAAIAKRTGSSVRDVGILAGRKLIGRTPSGGFVMDARGRWVRK